MKRFLCFLALFFMFYAYADNFLSEYVSRTWTTEDGLSGNSVNDILQDSKGYIFAGTYNGLVRFNGKDFENYNRDFDEKYGFSSVRSMFESSDGAIWVGSNEEGIYRLILDSNEDVLSFSTKNGLPNNSIRSICEDKSGNIWVATGGGISFISKDFKVVSPNVGGFGDLRGLCTSVFCDRTGRVWVTTSAEGGLYEYSGGQFVKHEFLEERAKNQLVTSVFEEDSGAIWFGVSPKYAVRFFGGREKIVELPFDAKIKSILQDKSGVIWFATDGGIFAYKDDSVFFKESADSSVQEGASKIIEDRDGNLWVATDYSGIKSMNRGLFRTMPLESSVNAIAEGKDGRVWFACDKGVECFRVNSDNSLVQETNVITEFCKGIRIRHIEIAKNGDILISSYAKLGQLRFTQNGNLVSQILKKDGLVGEKIRVAIEGKSGDLYVGTTSGFSIVKQSGEIENFTKSNGLSHEYVMCVFEDNDGSIYLGTDGGGVNVIKNGRVVNSYTTADGLCGNVIFKITKGSDGAIWFCTGMGISRFKDGKFLNYRFSNCRRQTWKRLDNEQFRNCASSVPKFDFCNRKTHAFKSKIL